LSVLEHRHILEDTGGCDAQGNNKGLNEVDVAMLKWEEQDGIASHVSVVWGLLVGLLEQLCGLIGRNVWDFVVKFCALPSELRTSTPILYSVRLRQACRAI
jgi:hypothetical protein